MVERVTIVDGKKIKQVVEYFSDEKELEALKSRAVLTMLKHRLESTIRQIESMKS